MTPSRSGGTAHHRARRRAACGLASLLMPWLLALIAPVHAEVNYPPVVPGVDLEFPRDEGAHPDYRIEWWYVTGWLQDETGAPLGFQVTFFRVRSGLGESNPSRFAPRQILFGHAAVADPAYGRLRHAERSARAGFDLAYAREGRVDVRLDDWLLRQDGDRYAALVKGEDFSLRLDLDRVQTPLLQGDRGYSRKGPSPAQASFYYSLPQLRVSGEIVVDGRARQVTGEAWFDHEWSSDVMDEQARGWDWMGVNLDDGGALMVFRMRDAQGGARWAAATLRSPDGSVRTFAPDEIAWTPIRNWRSPRTGAEYPVSWRVRVGDREFVAEPLLDDAELDSRSSTGTIYWEGPIRLRAPGGAPLGRGYLELTGYAGRLDL
jgi:predicted secreted hydrolase